MVLVFNHPMIFHKKIMIRIPTTEMKQPEIIFMMLFAILDAFFIHIWYIYTGYQKSANLGISLWESILLQALILKVL